MGLKQKVKSFQLPWLVSHGLKVSSRDPSSGVIVSVKCLFCEKFGWEVNVDKEKHKKEPQMWNTSNHCGEMTIFISI